jgi:membrane protein implicated in regulation of membrane protease activity
VGREAGFAHARGARGPKLERGRSGPLRTFTKFVLFEAAGWVLAVLVALALHEWAGLSPIVCAVLVAAWILKSFVTYPSVRKAYAGGTRTPQESLLDSTGVVVKPLRPVGIVRLGSELWKAEPAVDGQEIPRGRRVRVTEVRGLTLRVAETAATAGAGADPPAGRRRRATDERPLAAPPGQMPR